MTPPACAGSRSSASGGPRARKPRRPAAGARDGGAVADDAAIVFTPSGLRGRFALGTPVLQAARALGVDVDSVCGGRGICGRCQVTQVEGEFAKHGIVSRTDHLSAFSEVEQAYSARKPLQAGRRLSCTARILGDVVIDVPPQSQAHRQIVRKAAAAVAIALDPAIRMHYLEY